MTKLRPDMNIGGNIRSLRKKSNLTQAEVVVKMQLYGCDLSRMTYSKIERNLYNIRISELVALKQIFNAEYSDFFEGLCLKEIGD